MKPIRYVFFLFFIGAISHASNLNGYAQTGEELCRFIDNFEAGLNDASLMCAIDSWKYSSDECSFCNKLILEKRLTPVECLNEISIPKTKAQLDKCGDLEKSADIIHCLDEQ